MRIFSFFLIFLLLFLIAFSSSSIEAQESTLKIDIVVLKEDPEIIKIRQQRIVEIKNEREEIYSNIAELESLKSDYANRIRENEDKIEKYLKELAFIKSQADNKNIKKELLDSNTKFEVVVIELEDGQKIKLIKYHVRKNDSLKSIAERTYGSDIEQNYIEVEKRIASILQINNLFNVKNNLEGVDIIYIPFFK